MRGFVAFRFISGVWGGICGVLHMHMHCVDGSMCIRNSGEVPGYGTCLDGQVEVCGVNDTSFESLLMSASMSLEYDNQSDSS